DRTIHDPWSYAHQRLLRYRSSTFRFHVASHPIVSDGPCLPRGRWGAALRSCSEVQPLGCPEECPCETAQGKRMYLLWLVGGVVALCLTQWLLAASEARAERTVLAWAFASTGAGWMTV